MPLDPVPRITLHVQGDGDTGSVGLGDGDDGVIVVPRQYAGQVAAYAHEILDRDKQGRRDLYQKLGRPLDKTVEPD